MTGRELAEKILALENPDVPVVLVADRLGTLVRFADPTGSIIETNVYEEVPECSLPVGRHEILVLEPKGGVPVFNISKLRASEWVAEPSLEPDPSILAMSAGRGGSD